MFILITQLESIINNKILGIIVKLNYHSELLKYI